MATPPYLFPPAAYFFSYTLYSIHEKISNSTETTDAAGGGSTLSRATLPPTANETVSLGLCTRMECLIYLIFLYLQLPPHKLNLHIPHSHHSNLLARVFTLLFVSPRDPFTSPPPSPLNIPHVTLSPPFTRSSMETHTNLHTLTSTHTYTYTHTHTHTQTSPPNAPRRVRAFQTIHCKEKKDRESRNSFCCATSLFPSFLSFKKGQKILQDRKAYNSFNKKGTPPPPPPPPHGSLRLQHNIIKKTRTPYCDSPAKFTPALPTAKKKQKKLQHPKIKK